MSDKPIEIPRRTVLKAAAGLAIGQVAFEAACSSIAAGKAPTVAAKPSPAAAPPSRSGVVPPSPPGKPGDFDFLAGSWKIHHRRLKSSGGNDWDVFEGEATCWTILEGVASIEELRIPARGFSGMGLRLLDVEQRVWNDFWVNRRSGVLTTPGAPGSFTDGVGTFLAEDIDGDHPIKVRGVWDRITATSCRWHQAISRDGGKSWEENWFMDWVRA
jgi:hypothetical protein